MSSNIGKKNIAHKGSGHGCVAPAAMSLLTPPAPPAPSPFPYTARAANASDTASKLTVRGNEVLVEGSTMALDPPANQPAQSGGGDVVTHATKNIAVMTMGSFAQTVGGKGVCATGDMAALNVLTKQSKVAQMTLPLLEAGDFDTARKSNAAAAAMNRIYRRAYPPSKAKQCTGGEPVDLGTGYVVSDRVDLELRGLIPLVWSRSYSSAVPSHRGALGKGGWTHSFEQWVEETESGFRLHDEEGLPVDFAPPGEDGTSFHRGRRLTLSIHGHGIEIRGLDDRLTRTFARLPGGRLALAAIRDARDHRIELEYQGDVLTRIVDSVKREIRIKNDDRGRVVRVEVWARAPGSDEPPSLQTWFDYAYHPEGELASHTDALGHVEQWAYDGLHRMVRVTFPTGLSFHYEYHPELGHCVRTWGDGGLHDVRVEIDFEKGETCTHGTNRARRYLFRNGIVQREESYGGEWATERVYDDDELLVSLKNGAGEETAFEYDARGNLIAETDPAGNVTRWEIEDDTPVRQHAPTGLVTRYEYDRHGSLVGVVFPSGLSYRFDLDREGRIAAVFVNGSPRAKLTYDEHSNLATDVTARGATIAYKYDALGRPVERRDALGQTSRVRYDRMGRVTEQHRPDGTSVLVTRDRMGNVASVTDPLGHVTELAHAGTGYLARLTQADGQVYKFVYDADERLVQILNPRLERYEFEYDRADRIVRERTFDGRVLSYRHDRAGRVVRVDYPGDEWREFSHDKLGNVVEDRGADVQIAFTRDAFGRVEKAVCQDVTGKVVTELHRDPFGRVTADIQDGLAVRYEYDALGRRSARILPDGERTEYRYDEDDLFAGVTHEGRSVSIVRDALGRERARHARSYRVERAYDAMDRLTNEEVVANEPGGGVPALLARRRYAYDAKGRVTAIDSLHGGLTTYGYDRLDQLVEAVRGSAREVFEYDPAGSLVDILRDIDARGARPAWSLGPGNALRATGGARYVDDERGRRIQRIERAGGLVTTYGWDSKDRLREVVLPDGGRVRFTYDAFGRRTRKDVLPPPPRPDELLRAPAPPSRHTVQFLWDMHVLCEEREIASGGEARKRVHVHEPGSFVPMLQSEAGQVFGVVSDHLGMPKELVDERGRIAWRAEHDAWGAVTAVSRAEGTVPVESPFRLLGQYADAETGLAYVRFRYFDPRCARWLSPDPLGLLGGKNALRFDGSPTVVVDPQGLAAKKKCGPPSNVLERDLTGGKHASDRPLQDVIAEAGRRSDPNGPHGGRPIPIGRWASPEAAEAAAARMDPNGASRQVVDLQPGEGTVVYGGVKSYPEDPSAPSWMQVPADKALALRQPDGTIHTFPIDESHYLYGPAGDRP